MAYPTLLSPPKTGVETQVNLILLDTVVTTQ